MVCVSWWMSLLESKLITHYSVIKRFIFYGGSNKLFIQSTTKPNTRIKNKGFMNRIWKDIIIELNKISYVNNGARWIFTSFSLVIMALMLGNRFETSHYASYECGLFQKTVARVKYEITFYTVALTFLIFEYELLFIFPLLLSLQVSHKSF